MRLAGVELRDSVVAELACRLHEEGEPALAFHLGHAIDHLHDDFALSTRDRDALLRVLTDCPEDLADLRATLLADHIGRGRSLVA